MILALDDELISPDLSIQAYQAALEPKKLVLLPGEAPQRTTHSSTEAARFSRFPESPGNLCSAAILAAVSGASRFRNERQNAADTAGEDAGDTAHHSVYFSERLHVGIGTTRAHVRAAGRFLTWRFGMIRALSPPA